MRSNYHTHTKRCLHAFGTEEDYISAALNAGVSVLGFSDHAPFPDVDYGYRMPYSELGEYFAAVDRLREERADDIIIKKSLEIEYLPQYVEYYERLLEIEKVDYLLLGEHFYINGAGEFHNITQATGTEAYLDYAKAIAAALETGYFRMLAHPDLFTINKLAWDRNCDAATDIILNAAVKAGTVLEFNANGYRRGIHDYPDGRRYMYPHEKFWAAAKGTGLPVMVGSDCHEPYQVWDECMDRAVDYLKERGITPIELLE